ncbi:ABC transporter ATP-binding protein [Bacillus sp. FJAT-42315]|uniref:ABC transporter ATP-binding protein n=1 Tax=Bacillus sp. FJAT-42315 TaxID=2014077 RepID=UPI000C239779|nr:ABC transporter ATP-binding protein [Bacillus sp. FJAT-42315]
MSLLSIHIKRAGYEPNETKVADIQFSIGQGELVGLIGANGAGKSTTIKSILGLMPFFEGEIVKEEKMSLSYLPEQPVFYDECTLQEHIDFVAAMEQLTDEVVTERVTPLLELFHMSPHLHELPNTYSKGMQQKAMIILAFMTKPDFLIIDEPFIGLDPIATKILLELIRQEKERGAGILMCTHVLDTAEKVCDRFLFINSGELLADGTLGQLQATSKQPEASLFECYHQLIAGERHA